MPGNVHLTVSQSGHPLSGLTVYFLEADNTLVATASTDALGRAGATLHAGGSVTVLHGPFLAANDAHELESWVGVQPGDELALDLPSRSIVSLQVSAPVASIADVASYRVEAPCGATEFLPAGASGQLALEFCVGDPQTADLTVFAQDANEHDIAALVVTDLPISSGQPIAISGTYQPLQSVPITYEHAGALTSIIAEVDAPYSHGLMMEANVSLSGSLAGTFSWPPQITSGTRVIQSPGVGASITSWAPVGPSVDIDLAGLSEQAIASAPVLDTTGQQLAWTLANDGGAPADLNIASFTLEPPGSYIQWTIVSPGATAQIALPQLPDTIVDVHAPTSGATVTSLRVPGGTGYRTDVLGVGGYFAGFLGLIAASPTGVIVTGTPPSVPL